MICEDSRPTLVHTFRKNKKINFIDIYDYHFAAQEDKVEFYTLIVVCKITLFNQVVEKMYYFNTMRG